MENHGPRSTKMLQAIQKTIEATLESRKTQKSDISEDIVKEKLENLFSFYINDSLLQKLNLLDKQIEEKRVNLRSIKCENYIKEILESYIVEEKIDKSNFFNEKIKEENERKDILVKEIEEMKVKNEKLDVELADCESNMEHIISVISKSESI